jgi:predicted Zn finger-like uncharacterized protein|tara:strand:- start:557 stop:1024 length:468 start_codon:yes stop_codon:yes gene_type:complete
MIITCEKCSKKFNINDNLIPKEGRQLQCGSCGYKWYFEPVDKSIKSRNDISEETIFNNETVEKNKIEKIPEKQKLIQKKIIPTSVNEKKVTNKIKKSPKIIKNLLVLIISFVALITFLDTFKYQLGNYLPGLEFLLNNLYESIKDIFLFFKDLIN